MMIKLRNNSLSTRSFPPLAEPGGKGPSDWITLHPGCTESIDSARLKLYDSPALDHAFKVKDLEILPPEAPSRSLTDLVSEYEAQNAGKEVKPFEIKAH